MHARIRAAVLIAAMLAGIAPWLSRPAAACTPAPGFNPVSDSDLIVAGRILSWEWTGGTASAVGIPIRLRLAVDHVLRGSAGAEVTIMDDSLQHDGRWTAGGTCRAFYRDPTGVYVVLGLNRSASGDYSANIYRVFAFGPEPDNAGYPPVVERLIRNGESSLNLADPRPCIPETGASSCAPERTALWEGVAAAWAGQGISEAPARLAATIDLRARAGDQATLAALARGLSRPYLQVRTVRYSAESVTVMGWVSRRRAEFVEVVNLGGADQNLTGWTIQSVDRGITLSLPDGRVLKPRETWQILRADLVDVWPDDAGRVLLINPDGVVWADVRYSADPYNQPPPPNLEGVRLPR